MIVAEPSTGRPGLNVAVALPPEIVTVSGGLATMALLERSVIVVLPTWIGEMPTVIVFASSRPSTAPAGSG